MDGRVTMERLSEVAVRIGATGSKLEKVALLAAFLRDLDFERLPVATRFFTGRAFPLWDTRILQVGGAALHAVLLDLGGIDGDAAGRAWARHADVGDTFFDVLSGAGRAGAGGLDLLEVERGLDRVASAAGARARTAALRDLLARCSPLEARYTTKLIAGEMRIGLRDGLVEEAIAVAFGRDGATVSRADMLVGDLGEVAVMAAGGTLEQAAPRLFAPIRYMLASSAADSAEVVARQGEEVWVEDKYDGIRCQLHRDDDRVVLFSRDFKDVTGQFPEISEAARGLRGRLMLDGEVLAFRDGRVMPFASLQTRLGRRDPDDAVRRAVPVVYVAWDLLYQDGDPLLDLPLRERRRRLDGLHLGGTFALSHLEQATGAAQLDSLFDEARSRLNEGLMAKDPDGRYTPGRRGLSWLKLKKPLDTLDVVVLGAEYGHGRRRAVLSDVTFGVRVDGTDDLVPIGKAYTGLTDLEIAEMTAWLEAHTVRHHGRYREVEHAIVLEVAFDRVQESTRHRSGYALRFPRIARWRRDKGVAEIDNLSRVAGLAGLHTARREQRIDQA